MEWTAIGPFYTIIWSLLSPPSLALLPLVVVNNSKSEARETRDRHVWLETGDIKQKMWQETGLRRQEAGEEFSNVISEEFCAYYLSEAGEFVKLLRSLIANKKVN